MVSSLLTASRWRGAGIYLLVVSISFGLGDLQDFESPASVNERIDGTAMHDEANADEPDYHSDNDTQILQYASGGVDRKRYGVHGGCVAHESVWELGVLRAQV